MIFKLIQPEDCAALVAADPQQVSLVFRRVLVLVQVVRLEVGRQDLRPADETLELHGFLLLWVLVLSEHVPLHRSGVELLPTDRAMRTDLVLLYLVGLQLKFEPLLPTDVAVCLRNDQRLLSKDTCP